MSVAVNSEAIQVPPAPLRIPSVRRNFAWISAGYGTYSACQWAMVSALAKLGDTDTVGRYALGVAIATPILMLAQLNMRSVLVTDVSGEYRFEQYRNLRIIMLLAALGVICVLAFLQGGELQNARVIALVGLTQAVEWMSDIYQGRLQSHELMNRIALSLAVRGVLSLAALAGCFALTHSLPLALTCVVAARVAVLVLYDMGAASRGLSEESSAAGHAGMASWKILRTALPLGVVMFAASLIMHVPRYFIVDELGEARLGIYAALASIATAGGLFVNSLGQAATPRMARLFADGNIPGFRRLTWRLMAVGAALGVAAVSGSLLAGPFLLAAVYRPEYAAHSRLLTQLMVAGGFTYLAGLLGYSVTAARRFREQMPVQVSALAVTALTAWQLIPGRGLEGAAIAAGMGALTQIAGEIVILRSALAGVASR